MSTPQTGTSEAQPTYPQQQFQQYPQQAYYAPQQAPMDLGSIIGKALIFVIIGAGALLILIGKLIGIYTTDPDIRQLSLAIITFGAFVVATIAVLGGLLSKKTSDLQNLGLLMLGALVLVAYGAFLPFR